MTPYANAAMHQYRQTGLAAAAIETDPVRLTAMLYEGALDRLAQARLGMLRGEREAKHAALGRAIAIVEHLRLVLDLRAGGALAANLAALYDYMLSRLPAANAADDVAAVDEVIGLLREIKSAWDQLPRPAAAH